jgi:hypothetical protein
MLIDNLCKIQAFHIVDNLIDAGVYIRPVIADHAEPDLRALPYVIIADFRNGNREPVANPPGDLFYYAAFLLQREDIMQRQPKAAHADNHGLQLALQLFNDK